MQPVLATIEVVSLPLADMRLSETMHLSMCLCVFWFMFVCVCARAVGFTVTQA